jgi:hypothetical protein
MRSRSNSLNGGKTRPLTHHAYAALAELAVEAKPRQCFNAGVVDRITREPNPLAEVFDGPNPFKTSQKKYPTIQYLRLTPEGMRVHKERSR